MSRTRQFQFMRSLRVTNGIAKAILRCIDDHAGKSGTCWASLTTLAEESCFSRRTVIRAIAELEAAELIIANRQNGRTTTYRVNWQTIQNHTPDQCLTGTSDSHSTSDSQSGTSDSQSGTSDSQSPKALEAIRNRKKRQKFQKPNLKQIEDYCKEKSLSVDPVKFFEYFEAGEWTDSNGKPVLNWKQKLLTWHNHGNGKTNGKPDPSHQPMKKRARA